MSTATLTDNATTVGRMYEAFGRGDISYILGNLADNCKWIGAGEGSLPQGGTYIGKDAGNFFNRLLESEEFTSFNPQAIHNIGDNEVVAFGNMSARSRSTGKEASSDWVMHWRFNDNGKVIYFQDFFNTAAAYISHQ